MQLKRIILKKSPQNDTIDHDRDQKIRLKEIRSKTKQLKRTDRVFGEEERKVNVKAITQLKKTSEI